MSPSSANTYFDDLPDTEHDIISTDPSEFIDHLEMHAATRRSISSDGDQPELGDPDDFDPLERMRHYLGVDEDPVYSSDPPSPVSDHFLPAYPPSIQLMMRCEGRDWGNISTMREKLDRLVERADRVRYDKRITYPLLVSIYEETRVPLLGQLTGPYLYQTMIVHSLSLDNTITERCEDIAERVHVFLNRSSEMTHFEKVDYLRHIVQRFIPFEDLTDASFVAQRDMLLYQRGFPILQDSYTEVMMAYENSQELLELQIAVLTATESLTGHAE